MSRVDEIVKLLGCTGSNVCYLLRGKNERYSYSCRMGNDRWGCLGINISVVIET